MKKLFTLGVAFIMVMFSFAGCTAGSKNVTVATVENEVITDGEISFLIASSVESIKTQSLGNKSKEEQKEYWNTDIDGKKPTERIRENAVEYLINCAVFANVAKDASITISDREVDAQFKKTYDEETLSKLKKDYGISKSSIKAVLRKQLLQQKYNDRVLSKNAEYTPTNEQLKELFQKDYIKAKHILFPTENPETKAKLSDEEIKVQKELAQNVLAQIKSGGDFDALMNQHSKDPGSQSNPNGYVFTEGEMVSEFYEGAKALPVEGVSEIVQSSFGYHIIKRVPLLDTDMAEKEPSLKNAYAQKYTDDFVESLKSKYKINQDDAKINEIPVPTGL